MSDILNKLGTRDEPWTEKQIINYMDEMKAEVFDGNRLRRGQGDGRITKIVREDADGNEQTYVRADDGSWEKQ